MALDQRWAAVTSGEGLSVYELTKIGEPPRTLHHHTNLTSAAFSEDSSMLATGSEAGLVVLWSVGQWRPGGEIAAHGSDVENLAFAPDSTVLASAGDDGTIRLWNTARASAKVLHDKVAARACAAAPDGSWLAVVSDSITFYDPDSGQARDELEYAHGFYGLAPLRNGSLASEGIREILIWEPDNWRTSRTLHHPAGSTVIDLSTGGNLVCAVDSENRVVVWDAGTWEPPVFLEADDSGVRVRHKPATTSNSTINRLNRTLKRTRQRDVEVEATIAPGDEWLAMRAGKTIHVVTPKTWETVTTLSFDKTVDGMMAVPNGRRLAVRLGETIQYWNTTSWTVDREITDHDRTAANTGAWSPDGSLLATVSDDRTLRIHDSTDWTCLTELRLDGELTGCAWVGTDRLVAVGAHGVYWFTYVPGSQRPESPDFPDAHPAQHAEEARH